MSTANGAWEAWSVEVTQEGARKQLRTIREGATVHVASVGDVPAFRVTLREPVVEFPDAVTTGADAPIFVVADTHGEFEILVALLQRHRIVGRTLKWSFARGHLVLLGDVFDRGPHQTEILWLIYKLQVEARRAGGGVHLVLGNHETMVMSGDLRYLHSKYRKTAEVLGTDSYSRLFAPDSLLGQWLRAQPAVLRLNDLLCLHGGISRAVVDRNLTLAEINRTVRSALSGVEPETDADLERAKFIMGSLGPLWYRGYFPNQPDFPAASMEDIDRIRERFHVRAILVGHTIVPTVTSLYGGKVIGVQVYPRRDDQTGAPIMEGLRLENGRFFRARIDGSLEPLERPVQSRRWAGGPGKPAAASF